MSKKQIRNIPHILSKYQMQRAVEAGKHPFFVWVDRGPEFGPNCGITWSKDKHRIAWAANDEDCRRIYPPHTGWKIESISFVTALSFAKE